MPGIPDVVVIGSGIIGCAIAFELGRRGARVLVVDDRAPGAGATQASAGMLAPYNEIEDEGPHLELTLRGLAAFDDFVARVVTESAAPVQYHRTGTLTLAFCRSDQVRLERMAAMTMSRGVPAEVLDARELARAEPAISPQAIGGLIVPSHGFVAAGELTRALVQGALRHAVEFVATPRVTRVHRAGPDLTVDADTVRIVARQVVLAAGSWAGAVAVEGASVPVPVHPVRGQLLHLKAGSSNLRRVTWGKGCYLVPWDDGSLLVGATVEQVGFDERTTLDGMRELIDAVSATLMPGWPAAVVGVRAGLRPGTPDELPIIGRSSVLPGLVYATGHYRNGVLLAPITARAVADLLLEERDDPVLHAARPDRFGTL